MVEETVEEVITLNEQGVLPKYDFYPITEAAQDKIKCLRESFSQLEKVVLERCRPSRLLSIALTDLESAAMFAIKSIAHDPVSKA